MESYDNGQRRAENSPKEITPKRAISTFLKRELFVPRTGVAARAASWGPKASRKDKREEEEMSPRCGPPRLAHTTPVYRDFRYETQRLRANTWHRGVSNTVR